MVEMTDELKERYKKACDGMLLSMLGDDELVDKWWSGKNKAFEEFTNPWVAFYTNPKIVYDYLMWHCYAGGGS